MLINFLKIIFFKKSCDDKNKVYIFALTKKEEKFLKSGCGVIGSHARLRIWCRETWGFESLHPHNELRK